MSPIDKTAFNIVIQDNKTVTTANPNSNHLGFVLIDKRLPNFAPITDPTITINPSIHSILPFQKNIPMATNAVKIVASNDVAIAFLTSTLKDFRKGGNKEPPLPPLIPVIIFKIEAPGIMV